MIRLLGNTSWVSQGLVVCGAAGAIRKNQEERGNEWWLAKTSGVLFEE